MNLIDRINRSMERGATKIIFDHVRNYLIGAFILAIGTTELRRGNTQVIEFVPEKFAGLGVIALAIVLICINLYDGIRQIWKTKYHVSLSVMLVLLYIFMSARVIEMAWDFRDMSSLPVVP